jgi:hypothetical protein
MDWADGAAKSENTRGSAKVDKVLGGREIGRVLSKTVPEFHNRTPNMLQHPRCSAIWTGLRRALMENSLQVLFVLRHS